jgi:hypothetical protein
MIAEASARDERSADAFWTGRWAIEVTGTVLGISGACCLSVPETGAIGVSGSSHGRRMSTTQPRDGIGWSPDGNGSKCVVVANGRENLLVRSLDVSAATARRHDRVVLGMERCVSSSPLTRHAHTVRRPFALSGAQRPPSASHYATRPRASELTSEAARLHVVYRLPGAPRLCRDNSPRSLFFFEDSCKDSTHHSTPSINHTPTASTSVVLGLM